MYFEGLFIGLYNMKTTLVYEVFYFFEGIYFGKPFNFECLILEI